MHLFGIILISCTVGFLQLAYGRLNPNSINSPDVTVSPSVNQIYVRKGSRLVIDCPISSNSTKISFHWLKDDTDVKQQKRVKIDKNNGSLIIAKVLNKRRRGRNDTGIYECFVENSFGRFLGRRVEIIIIKPSLTLTPETVSTYLGGVARFQCQLSDPTQLKPVYLWQTPTSNEDRIYMDEVSSYMGVLHVYNVSQIDVGSYTCKVVLQDGMLEKSAFLDLIEDSSGFPPSEPILLNTSQHITVAAGHDALLECLPQGGTNIVITWIHVQPGNKPVVASDKVTLSGNSKLRITNIQHDDSGTYRCVVRYSGSYSISREYSISVLEAPSFRNEKVMNLSNVLVQRARLYCNATGNPTPDIYWYKDGLKIYPPPKTELVIHGRSDENGYYQCMATNTVGYEISTTWVVFDHIPNTPDRVENVLGTAISPTEIILRWEPVSTPYSSPVIAYSIDYHKVNELKCPGRCIELFQGAREVSLYTTHTIKNLHPYTLYAFAIQGVNSKGAGTMSEEIMVRTKTAVPSAVPEVEIIPDTEISFRVTWSELPPDKANGIITQHKLLYKTDEGLQTASVTLNGDTYDYLILDVKPDTLYKVQVVSGNSAGSPELLGSWVTYKTPKPGEAFQAATSLDLSLESINSSSVLLRWSGQPQNVISNRIMIQKQLQGGPVHEYNVPATMHKFVIGGLENRTFYKIYMMMEDVDGNLIGMAREQYQSLNPQDIREPPPPIILTSKCLSSSVLQVSWQRPKTNLTIDKYTVKYQMMWNNQISEPPRYVESFSQTVRLIGLQSFSVYMISVRSHSKNRHGPFSKPITDQTLEGVPSPPENILAEVVSPGTVKLQWGPPRKQNGIIRYYIIYYNPDKNVPDRSWSSIQQNASTTSIIVHDLTGNVYYFKLRACTMAGEGNSSDIIMINTLACEENSCLACSPQTSCVTSSPDDAGMSRLFEQRLGIVIGCAVGLVCIVIFIAVITVIHRTYKRLRAAAVYAHTSNDHHVGRYLSQHTSDETAVETSYLPFLHKQEAQNRGLDSKGGQYGEYRGESEVNLVMVPAAPGDTEQQVPVERRALLSPSTSGTSGCQGNDTSSTLESGTLESSFTVPEKTDSNSTDSGMASNKNTELNSSEDNSPCTGTATEQNGLPIERSHSGSHDSGFDLDTDTKGTETDKLCSYETKEDTEYLQCNVNC